MEERKTFRLMKTNKHGIRYSVSEEPVWFIRTSEGEVYITNAYAFLLDGHVINIPIDSLIFRQHGFASQHEMKVDDVNYATLR